MGLNIFTNESFVESSTELHLDPTQPMSYRTLQHQKKVEAFISAPWPRLLDLAFPLAVRFATKLVCFHVPGQYVVNAPVPRSGLLKALQKEGRLKILMGAPIGGTAEQAGVWLCVFASAPLAKELVKPAFHTTDSVLFVS